MPTYNEKISHYIDELFAVQDEALLQAWENIPKKGLPAINITPEEGRCLQFLVRACSAKKALEIGTLGGYSGIWIARGLLPGGKLITLEIQERHAQVAREHFALAGLSDQVEVCVGDAHTTLSQLSSQAPFDFVFIDADKPAYSDYFDWAMENTRLGGVIATHNAFRHGAVADEADTDINTQVIRSLNQRVAQDPRLISTIYPAGDGTLVCVKIA
jgi:caffeoyl-CoA O-methyltransferase